MIGLPRSEYLDVQLNELVIRTWGSINSITKDCHMEADMVPSQLNTRHTKG